ncbi:MAG: SH3 domain-containing protein [Chloroflexi bacterium]|nr:SH3 domain-containing protein [Chloroflexota bacterium]
MDFVTAEEKFQELQARIRRGEPLSEDQYQEELAKLMVQDDAGIFWSLEPGTGRWLYFNGTEWMPGTPPRQTAPPPVVPPLAPPTTTAPEAGMAYTQPVESYPSFAAPSAAPASEPPSYYAPSDVTHSTEYPGAYTGAPEYATAQGTPSSYLPPTSDASPAMGAEGLPTYVRMPEPEAPPPTGGIPPRPVRDISPLAVPGGERAWLPFAFGALVLLLCAVILFFGVRGLPQFSGGTADTQPTEEPTEVVEDVLPTPTVELVSTRAPKPTVAPTEVPPTPEPQPVTAVATDVLNIRQGPARTTPSLGKLQKGQSVTVVGRNGDASWLQIQIPDKTDLGWVSAEFVTVNGDVNSLPVTSGNSGNPAPQPTETPTG